MYIESKHRPNFVIREIVRRPAGKEARTDVRAAEAQISMH